MFIKELKALLFLLRISNSKKVSICIPVHDSAYDVIMFWRTATLCFVSIKYVCFFFFFFFFFGGGGGGGGGGGEFYFIWHNIKTPSTKLLANCPTPQKSHRPNVRRPIVCAQQLISTHFIIKLTLYMVGSILSTVKVWMEVLYFHFLTPAHKGWGYSRPLRRPGGGGGHKSCGCSTA